MFEFISDILIPIIFGFFGVMGGIWYSSYVTYRQEKAVLVTLIQEFTLLIGRLTLYYTQYLNPERGVSYSTLFDLSDEASFIKLSEVARNKQIIQTALQLKADFFQVIRFADKASEALIRGNQKDALSAQSMALVFFLGDKIPGDKFKRDRYKEYIKKINILLNHLQELNTLNWFNKLIINLTSSLKKELSTTDNFIADRREFINERERDLDSLRKTEKDQQS